MRYLLIFILLTSFNICGHAHETNEAFFTIIQKKKTIEITAEFPWTMRNALIQFNPSLEKSTKKKDFEYTFVNYIKANLILKDKRGNLIKYVEYRELENTGHSHQNNYLLIFKGNGLKEITNTIMFDVYETQVNYNTITIDSNRKTIQTHKEQISFVLDTDEQVRYWYLFLLLMPIAYIGYRFGNKKEMN